MPRHRHDPAASPAPALRSSPRRRNGFLFGAILAVLLPSSSGAVEAPPPERLPQLTARAEAANRTRIVTGHSTLFAERVRFETDAVVLAGPRRVALVELGTPPEKRDTRIPWAEVESISAGRARTAHGFAMGALAGAATMGVLVGSFGTDLADRNDNAVVYFGAAVGVGMTILGGLIGSGQHTWTQLYP